ncbi:TPA: hypothetical protein REU56_002935, partial [Listeria monocytogenes]|nr:hypothetical protein [Listeria monocytogenes]
ENGMKQAYRKVRAKNNLDKMAQRMQQLAGGMKANRPEGLEEKMKGAMANYKKKKSMEGKMTDAMKGAVQKFKTKRAMDNMQSQFHDARNKAKLGADFVNQAKERMKANDTIGQMKDHAQASVVAENMKKAFRDKQNRAKFGDDFVNQAKERMKGNDPTWRGGTGNNKPWTKGGPTHWGTGPNGKGP